MAERLYHLYTLAGVYVDSFRSLGDAMHAGAGFSYVIKSQAARHA